MLVLPASAEVIAGLVDAADAAPDALSIIANITKAPPLPFLPAEWHGEPVVMASMVFAGDGDAGARAIAPIRALAPPLADMVRPIRYQEMYEAPEPPRPGFDAGTNLLVSVSRRGRRRRSSSTSKPPPPTWPTPSSAFSAARWRGSPTVQPRSGIAERR